MQHFKINCSQVFDELEKIIKQRHHFVKHPGKIKRFTEKLCCADKRLTVGRLRLEKVKKFLENESCRKIGYRESLLLEKKGDLAM